MSDYTRTPNYNLYKPIPNADGDNWGPHLNWNADTLDSLLGPGGALPFLPLAGGGTISNAFLRLDGPAGTARGLWYSSGLSSRWQIMHTADAEAGGNTGSNLAVYSYSDSGAFIGTALGINRASGPVGLSGPFIYQLAPWRQQTTRGSYPNGVIGNWQNLGKADRQPAMPLGNNPLATTAGSPVVTVTWPGACNASTGWVGANQFGAQTWLNFQGVAAVGGITPAGWLMVRTLVDNDHFTVTWTANATATVAAGGGAGVTVQPSHTTTLNRVASESTTGANGFPVQTAETWECNPDFTQPPGTPGVPRYEQRWHWLVGPSDAAGASSFNITGIEWDLTHRGRDYGYQPNLYRASQASIAFWVGPVVVPPFATGGGTPVNWGSVYTVFSGQNDAEVLGVYQAFTCQPNSLVGQKFDPVGGHGGVGVDLFGSYTALANPFATTLGSAVVTVSVGTANLTGMANGDQAYIPVALTLNGTTFGNATYTIANVNVPAGTFTVTGTGNATSSGAGGGANAQISFVPLAPYAPFQTWGLFQHGLITAPGSQFLSGGIIETQPGNGILWNDGTVTASVNTVAVSPGNIDINIVPMGTGRVFAATNNFTMFAQLATATAFNMFGAAGTIRQFYIGSGNLIRWSFGVDNVAEGGANAGSNISIGRYADAGNWLGNPLAINRATGNVTFSGSIGVNGSAAPAKPTVTGSRAANAALASLLTALATYGLVTDNSTA